MTDQIKYEDAIPPDEGMEEDVDLPVAPMTTEEMQTEGARLIREAVDYNVSELEPHRQQATNYYMGRPFGDEEEGRSQVVATEVKDTIDAIMPSIMRMFFGPDRVVEFEPRHPEDEEFARMATEYVNYIIQNDNNGVIELHNAVKDAALRRMGVVKYWWDDTTEVESHSFQGLTEDQLVLFEADPRIEYNVVGQYDFTDPVALQQYTLQQQQYDAFVQQNGTLPPGAQPPQPPPPLRLYDVEVKFTNSDGRARFAAVPPEEFIFTPARNVAESTLVGQRQDKTLSDLRVMGIPEDILEELQTSGQTGSRGSSTELTDAPSRIAREVGERRDSGTDASGPNQKIPYYEVYVYMDVDNDDITEHRKQVYVGTEPKLVWDDPAPDRPFAIFELDPEPHTMTGMDIADRTMDLQLTKSKVLRGTLDSLAFSLHPRTVAVEGEASIADIMNTEIGAIIRERQPGMVRTLQHEFVGQYALPFLQYFDGMRENRTGISKAAAGLDPDALQSTTKAAVAATVSGAQQRLELYCRMLAETGMKQLMRGLLKLIVANQSKARQVRLRNQYVNVDPRSWDATMDVTINVAVGYTVTEERIQALVGIAAKQEQILQTMGPNNPFVTMGQYSQTLRKLTELAGFPDTQQYFNVLPPQWNPEPQPPKPSPEEVLAQAQAEKVRIDAQIAQAELELKRQEVSMREDRERDRIEADLFLRAKEIELKYSTKIQETEVKAKLQRTRKDTNVTK